MNIVVTGSRTGIGLAITKHLLAEGHFVWGISRNPQWSLMNKYEGPFKFSACDVLDWKQMSAAAGHVASEWTWIDAIITCAGQQGAAGRATEVDPDRWNETVHTNLDGTFYAIRAFAPLLTKVRRPKIICFSGGGAVRTRPNFAAYSASKAGVVRLVEAMAVEEKEFLDINVIAPGGINTRLTDELIERGPAVVGEVEFKAALKQKENGGGSIDKVVSLVDWLLSEKSDGTTGRLIAAQWDSWGGTRL